MKLNRIFGLAAAGMIASLANQSAQADQNLLSNGGFESGDFTGWAVTGDTSDKGVSTSFATTPFDGTYSAFFGAVGDHNIISQTITTTVGHTYNLSFALFDKGNGFADMYVDWAGNQVYDVQPGTPFPWTQVGLNVTATGTSTTVTFGFEQVPSYFNFDDASVVDLNQNIDYPPILNTNVPDQGVGLWLSAATLLGLCVVAGVRRQQTA